MRSQAAVGPPDVGAFGPRVGDGYSDAPRTLRDESAPWFGPVLRWHSEP